MLLGSKNILVVASHPDDEVLGCAGTLLKLGALGANIHILILGEGVTSRFDQREMADQNEVLNLKQTALDVGVFLGATQVYFGDLPDNRFDTLPLLDIIKIIEKCIHTVKPDTLFCQHGGDLNIDHCITYRAVMTATRPVEGACVKNLLAFEVASSTEWAFSKFEPRFNPNYFVNIDGFLDQKIKALSFYESEVRHFPHPRSTEALQVMAKNWGRVAGLPCVEAFEMVRCISD